MFPNSDVLTLRHEDQPGFDVSFAQAASQTCCSLFAMCDSVCVWCQSY